MALNTGGINAFGYRFRLSVTVSVMRDFLARRPVLHGARPPESASPHQCFRTYPPDKFMKIASKYV